MMTRKRIQLDLQLAFFSCNSYNDDFIIMSKVHMQGSYNLTSFDIS